MSYSSRDTQGIRDIHADLADTTTVLQEPHVLLQQKWEVRQIIWGILNSARHIGVVTWAGPTVSVASLLVMV